jgi:hypothetical protein
VRGPAGGGRGVLLELQRALGVLQVLARLLQLRL